MYYFYSPYSVQRFNDRIPAVRLINFIINGFIVLRIIVVYWLVFLLSVYLHAFTTILASASSTILLWMFCCFILYYFYVLYYFYYAFILYTLSKNNIEFSFKILLRCSLVLPSQPSNFFNNILLKLVFCVKSIFKNNIFQ